MVNFSRSFGVLLAVVLLPCAGAFSQQQQMMRYSSGTGFFVSFQGHIITNAHVVQGCQSITIDGAVRGPATLIGTDPAQDLAMLKFAGATPKVAPLRWNLTSLRIGETVTVAGFPGQAGFNGQLTYVPAKLLGMQGPTGEPQYLQFTSAAQKGNSGGPLLDMSGNVIGVVTGKTQLYEYTPTADGSQGTPTLVREADVAITVPYLRNFLQSNRVRFNTGGSGLVQANERSVAQNARASLVHISCLLGIE